MKYTQPHNETDPNAGYKDFNLETGEPGSIPPAIALEAPQREIVNAILSAGLTPDAADNTQLTRSIDSKIANYAQSIASVSATSGTVALTTNTVYKMTVSDATTFVLPATVNASVHNQIKLFLNLSAVVSVNWGTTLFFNETAPEIDAVGKYCVYWDYDPNAGNWVCGGMKEGIAV